MKKVRNSLNYDHTLIKGEVFTLPSETIPDQVMSVKEIFARYARGSSVLGRTDAWYDEDSEDIPDPERLDLEERWRFAQEAEETISNIKNRKNEKTESDTQTKDVSGEQQS